MIATAFDEENAVLNPPPGVDLDKCSCLSVYRGSAEDGTPVIISCWKPTPEEWAEMRKTGRVWLVVVGRTMPPVSVLGTNPFNTEGKT